MPASGLGKPWAFLPAQAEAQRVPRDLAGPFWAEPTTQLDQGGRPHAAQTAARGLCEFAHGSEAFPRSPRIQT